MGTPQVASRWRKLADRLAIDKPERFERLLDIPTLLSPRGQRNPADERAEWLTQAFEAAQDAAIGANRPPPQFALALDGLLAARGMAHGEAETTAYLKGTESRMREERRVLLALRASVAQFRQLRDEVRQRQVRRGMAPEHRGPAIHLEDPEAVTALLDALWPHLEPVRAFPRGGWTRDKPGRPPQNARRLAIKALKDAGIPARWPRDRRPQGMSLRPRSLHDAILMAVGLTPLR